MLTVDSNRRVLSGMRASGWLHLGHYHGVIKNWVRLQKEFDCFFFVADLHGLTTHYENPSELADISIEMVIDWLAAGVNPGASPIFLQSHVPQHAELHLLLSMVTPLSWLERVPTFKEQQEKIKDKDLSTYGFLGYPLLQTADVLLYRAGHIPVGQDQVPHIEISRDIARRFNYLYGTEPGFEDALLAAQKKMGKKLEKLYARLRRQYQEQGDVEALETARALVRDQQNITVMDKERLLGGLDGHGRIILPEPQALLTANSKLLGLDGQKMSKSYGNTIALREEPDAVVKKIKGMKTDPARQRRTDPGNPDVCPVWSFHELYSSDETKTWVREGCTTAGIGCIDCKMPIIDAVNDELQPFRIRAAEYQRDIGHVRQILTDGAERAQEEAEATMDEVRNAMGLGRTF